MSTYASILAAIDAQLTTLRSGGYIEQGRNLEQMLLAMRGQVEALANTSGSATMFGVLASQQFAGRTAKAIDVHGTRSGTWSAGFTDVSNVPLVTVGTQAVLPILDGTEPMEVVSSSANDTANGSGARTVRLYGTDASGAEQEVTVTLNGTTPVSLGELRWTSINIMEVASLGTVQGVAAGAIDVRTVSGPTVIERIAAGINRSRSARFRVPVGYSAVVLHWNAGQSGSGSATGQVILRTDTLIDDGITPNVFHVRGSVYVPVGDARNQDVGFRAEGGSTIKVSAIATGSAIVDAQFTVYLIATE